MAIRSHGREIAEQRGANKSSDCSPTLSYCAPFGAVVVVAVVVVVVSGKLAVNERCCNRLSLLATPQPTLVTRIDTRDDTNEPVRLRIVRAKRQLDIILILMLCLATYWRSLLRLPSSPYRK
jgi:hypothetical protein